MMPEIGVVRVKDSYLRFSIVKFITHGTDIVKIIGYV